jgi:uncharacterized protein YvpB
MESMHKPGSQGKLGQQPSRAQPFRVRLLAWSFGALVVCDLLVFGLVLDLPARLGPVTANLPAAFWQLVRGMGGAGDPAPVPVSPTIIAPSATQTVTAAAVSATPFTPQTFTPTASPTETALPTETATPEPSATPEPPPPPVQEEPQEVQPPDSALVEGVTGYYQSLPLSCESRSAADWARFFGFEINELDFQYALPFTDNPETGFVGDPRDMGGGIPPYSYGVHAGPVATLLRAYGVPAEDQRWFSYDALRWEIASGRPVIVWVINNVLYGSGVSYTASDGQTTTVAPLEHTVMVVGYTPDAVIIQDGGGRYQVPVDRFLNSWGALENMAVTAP